MLPQVSAAVRVFLCTKPADMRKSFDGLLGMVGEFIAQDPLSGHFFLFFNRRRDRVKILLWDRDGLVIGYKRLEAGTFQELDPRPGANFWVRGPGALSHRLRAAPERCRSGHRRSRKRHARGLSSSQK